MDQVIKDRRACVLIGFILLIGCKHELAPSRLGDAPQRLMSTAAAEAACNRGYLRSEQGKRLGWKGRVPVVFSFDEAVLPSYVTAITSAMHTWNAAAGYEIFRVDPRPRAASIPARDGRNTIYLYAEDTPERRRAFGAANTGPGRVAATYVRADGNRLVDTDIVFDGVHNPYTARRVHFASFDIEHTALHELGHALGLGHTLNPWSTMFTYGAMSSGVSLRYIDDQTKALLDCEYR